MILKSKKQPRRLHEALDLTYLTWMKHEAEIRITRQIIAITSRQGCQIQPTEFHMENQKSRYCSVNEFHFENKCHLGGPIEIEYL